MKQIDNRVYYLSGEMRIGRKGIIDSHLTLPTTAALLSAEWGSILNPGGG